MTSFSNDSTNRTTIKAERRISSIKATRLLLSILSPWVGPPLGRYRRSSRARLLNALKELLPPPSVREIIIKLSFIFNGQKSVLFQKNRILPEHLNNSLSGFFPPDRLGWRAMQHSTLFTFHSFFFPFPPLNRRSIEMPSVPYSDKENHRFSSPILSGHRWACLPPTLVHFWSKVTYPTKMINRHLLPIVPCLVNSHRFQRDRTVLPRFLWCMIRP